MTVRFIACYSFATDCAHCRLFMQLIELVMQKIPDSLWPHFTIARVNLSTTSLPQEIRLMVKSVPSVFYSKRSTKDEMHLQEYMGARAVTSLHDWVMQQTNIVVSAEPRVTVKTS